MGPRQQDKPSPVLRAERPGPTGALCPVGRGQDSITHFLGAPATSLKAWETLSSSWMSFPVWKKVTTDVWKLLSS